jgi:hypothetical protein
MNDIYLQELEKKEKNGILNLDLEEMFFVFESYKNINQVDKYDRLLAQIIDISFGILNKKIEKRELISLNDDIYAVRAIYTKAVLLWKDSNFEDSLHIFVFLYRLLDDEVLKVSILSHLSGVINSIEFDEFYKMYVDCVEDELDKQKYDNYQYFIVSFNENMHKFLENKMVEIKNIIGEI